MKAKYTFQSVVGYVKLLLEVKIQVAFGYTVSTRIKHVFQVAYYYVQFKRLKQVHC